MNQDKNIFANHIELDQFKDTPGDYIIIGDTEKYKDCLIYTCGTFDNAKRVLHRMLENPKDEDKRVMETHYNIRIEAVPKHDCWWHVNCD